MEEEALYLVLDTESEEEVEENPEVRSAQRKLRAARRAEKAARKAGRQAAKLRNSLRCDARPHVRLAAVEAIAGLNNNCTSARHDTGVACSQAPAPADGQREKGSEWPEENGPAVVSLFGLDLTEFTIGLLPPWLNNIRSLDLSYNELSQIPGLERLTSLTELDLCRNRLRALPPSLVEVPSLTKLNVSRNDLRPSLNFLQLLLRPPGMRSLQELDITFNRKCFTQDLEDLLTKELPNVNLKMTVTFPPPPGAKVGELASVRDPSLLRSQLEPYTTLQLRRRLVEAFGEEPYTRFGPSPPARAEVMQRLLDHYAKAGIGEGQERKVVKVNGTPVRQELLDELLVLLREWATKNPNHQERPNIYAQSYMILRSPTEFERKLKHGSRRATTASKKFEQNERLWKHAAVTMASVDPDFAAKFTGLAVTRSFRGSPHIDTSNIGPFYGLAVGDFAEGTGGIRVELDAMTVAEVNTKGRLGKVDGRYPHWVAPYDEDCERFSLIYYQTEGEVEPQLSAIFGDVTEG